MSSKFRENPFIVSLVSVFILTAIVKINNYDDDCYNILVDVKERVELSYVNITYVIQFGNSYSSTSITPWRIINIRQISPEDCFWECTRMNDNY